MRRPAIPVGLTPEAEKERARFMAAYHSNLRRIKQVALSILIWGPDPKRDSPVARKRKELKDLLLADGHNAMFSEELASENEQLSDKSLEFAQALAAHLIFVLVEDSPGAVAEAHDFCNHPEIASKICVLIPKRYKRGYSAKGAIKNLEDAHGGVFWYSDADLAQCHVCTRAIKRANGLRQLHWMHGKRGSR